MQKLMSILVCLLVLLPSIEAFGQGLPGLMVQTVGELERIELITGSAAQKEVNRLHGKSLAAEASAVARYAIPGSTNHPAEVWVSRVSSEQEARRQTGEMVHKMFENPNSPFRNPHRLDHAGKAVYRFEGMGMVHLIWYSGDLVFWISAESDHEFILLEAFCR